MSTPYRAHRSLGVKGALSGPVAAVVHRLHLVDRQWSDGCDDEARWQITTSRAESAAEHLAVARDGRSRSATCTTADDPITGPARVSELIAPSVRPDCRLDPAPRTK